MSDISLLEPPAAVYLHKLIEVFTGEDEPQWMIFLVLIDRYQGMPGGSVGFFIHVDLYIGCDAHSARHAVFINNDIVGRFRRAVVQPHGWRLNPVVSTMCGRGRCNVR